jgi:hypothetical protein
MAGAAITSPMVFVKPDKVNMLSNYEYLIKNAEVVNQGDLVGLDSNGFVVVATNAAGAIIKPLGAAFFDDDNIGVSSRTGDGAYVTCSIVKKFDLQNATSTLVPSLGKGKPIYLGAVPTSTVSNYTCAFPSVNGTAVVEVGVVGADGTTLHIYGPFATFLQYQTSGNSIVGAG